MKKVILLGDSIRQIGYGPHIQKLLGEEFEVWQPEDNCRFSTYTLRLVFDCGSLMKGADVIHWNNGLWDTCDLFGDGPFTPLDVYVETLIRIATVLKTYAKRVIFATTTVPSPKMWGHDAMRISAFNKAAIEALTPLGIEINDLFPLVYGHEEEMICDDLIHLSPYGKDVLAEKVAQVIKNACDSIDNTERSSI